MSAILYSLGAVACADVKRKHFFLGHVGFNFGTRLSCMAASQLLNAH